LLFSHRSKAAFSESWNERDQFELKKISIEPDLMRTSPYPGLQLHTTHIAYLNTQ